MFTRHSIFANISKMFIYHFHSIDIVLQLLHYAALNNLHMVCHEKTQLFCPPDLHEDEDEPDIDPQEQDPPSLVLAARLIRICNYMFTFSSSFIIYTHVYIYKYTYMYMYIYIYSFFRYITAYIYSTDYID